MDALTSPRSGHSQHRDATEEAPPWFWQPGLSEGEMLRLGVNLNCAHFTRKLGADLRTEGMPRVGEREEGLPKVEEKRIFACSKARVKTR